MSSTPQERTPEKMEEIYTLADDTLSKLPAPIRSLIKKDLEMLKKVIIDSRLPKFAFVGRRGAGKSSLLNSIFGEKVAKVGSVKSQTGMSKWYTYKSKLGSMEIMDSRGMGEGSKPDESYVSENEINEIKNSIKEKCPDAILFLCGARDTDSRIKEDIQNLKDLCEYIYEVHNYKIPIVTIATRSDELDPLSDRVPPFQNPTKLKNINAASENLYQKVVKEFPESISQIAVSAYLEFDENGKIVVDYRWNIDKLVELLLEQIPQSAQLELARLSQFESLQKKLARKIVQISSGACAVIGAEPIPFADLPFITGIQIGMIIGIGYIAGNKMNKDSAIEFTSAMGISVGAALGFRELTRALVKLIPGAGSYISAGVAYAGTYALGESAITYFIDKKSKREAQKIYDSEFKKKKKE